MSLFVAFLLLAQAAPPGGGGPIYAHPLSQFLDAFERVCVANQGSPERQVAASHSQGFSPVVGHPSSYARQSVSVSIRRQGDRDQCAVSGLVTDRTDLDSVFPAVSQRFSLGEPQFGTQAGTEIALWGYGPDSPRTIMARARPETVMAEDGTTIDGPGHLVLTLSTPKTEAQ